MSSTHFFITGGTGLIGTSLLPRILRTYPETRITLLVRSQSGDDARARAMNIAAEIAGEPGCVDAVGQIEGIRGDISLEHMGLGAAERISLIKSVTHIVHGAATIRFDHPIEEARAINCGGVMKALDLAQTCVEIGRLERFVYIGTSSVSGRRAGTILEDELEMGQLFFNTYEQSKCESERLVRNRSTSIPTIIFRPSIVIGDSRTGRTTSFNVIYIPLRLLQRGLLSYVPGSRMTTLDLVPVDWVAETMVYLMGRAEAVGRVFHQTAGPMRAARLGEVVLGAIGYFDQHSPLRRPRTMEFITLGEFDRRRAAMKGREEALMSQLDTLLPYVTVDRLFDSRNTDSLLVGSGIEFPLFKDYSGKIYEYCLQTNWGKTGD